MPTLALADAPADDEEAGDVAGIPLPLPRSIAAAKQPKGKPSRKGYERSIDEVD